MQITGSGKKLQIGKIALIGLGFVVFVAATSSAYFHKPQAFAIPSSSNAPTVLAGDWIIASRYKNGNQLPKRGDMVVFTNPHTGETYIKRAVGLPGDRIQVAHGILIVNGEAWRRERIGEYRDRNWLSISPPPLDTPRYHYRETLPDGSAHEILGGMTTEAEDSLPQDNTNMFQVPDGHFFAIGDNRDNSLDSRLGLGYVPLANLIGRVDFCYFSWTKIPDGRPHIRWERMLRAVR